MSNFSTSPAADDMADQHVQAVLAWRRYFQLEAHSTEPAIGLLSILADTLNQLPPELWAQCLYSMKLLDEDSAKAVNKLLTMRHAPQDMATLDISPDAKTWALFMNALFVLAKPLEPDLSELDALTHWFPQNKGLLPGFVKRCWDGYFLFARQVAWCWEAEDFQEWPMVIPGVRVKTGQEDIRWLVIDRCDLEVTEAAPLLEIAQAKSGCLQTRYVWYEFRWPALWQGVDRAERGPDKFSAVKTNVNPSLPLRDLGLASGKGLRFLRPSKNEKPARVQGNSFYGLRGLLWAMGLDEGLRRSGRLQKIQEYFLDAKKNAKKVALNNMNQPGDFYSAAEVLPAVQAAVGGTQPSNQRFAVSQAVQRQRIEAWSIFSLNVQDAQCLWQEQEGTHVLHMGDSSHWRLAQWKDGAFYALAGGRAMPVVLGIEGHSGAVEEWVWGSCEQWGLNEDGSSTFEVWPWVDDAHAFHQPDQPIHVQDAMILDMSKWGNFRSNYFVLYVRVCWL